MTGFENKDSHNESQSALMQAEQLLIDEFEQDEKEFDAELSEESQSGQESETGIEPANIYMDENPLTNR